MPTHPPTDALVEPNLATKRGMSLDYGEHGKSVGRVGCARRARAGHVGGEMFCPVQDKNARLPKEFWVCCVAFAVLSDMLIIYLL